MIFRATKHPVGNRGVPPDSFLLALIEWARIADDEIFAPNDIQDEVYTKIRPQLGPWVNAPYRKAALLETMRVHAGLESSWNWAEGVDRSNVTSMHNRSGEETGIFQVSFDSLALANGHMRGFAEKYGISNVDSFLSRMKVDHHLALEYYARLVRVDIRWAGPILHGKINPWLSRDSALELQSLL